MNLTVNLSNYFPLSRLITRYYANRYIKFLLPFKSFIIISVDNIGSIKAMIKGRKIHSITYYRRSIERGGGREKPYRTAQGASKA